VIYVVERSIFSIKNKKMKLTINRITLLFGLILFANFFFFGRVINEYIIAAIFGACLALGIHNRKSDKPYAYGRGVLIGIRILLLGIIYWFVFLLFGSVIKTFISSLHVDGVNIIQATQHIMYLIASSLPSLIVISIVSLVLMLIIPLFFIQKSKQNNDIIDADLVDNEQT